VVEEMSKSALPTSRKFSNRLANYFLSDQLKKNGYFDAGLLRACVWTDSEDIAGGEGKRGFPIPEFDTTKTDNTKQPVTQGV
jgi:hypothetical protein